MKLFRSKSSRVLCFLSFMMLMKINMTTAIADPIPDSKENKNDIAMSIQVTGEKGEMKVPDRGKAARERVEREAQRQRARGQATVSVYSDKPLLSGDVGTLLEYAYSYLGRPYVWGAKGPYSFDCSGFTSYVYKMVGIYIPSYTGDQVKYGKSVAKEDLLPGDVIFFNTYMDYGHVGIYVGNNKFIHASSSSSVRRVTVSSLTGYHLSHYAGARRIIQD
ncbi:C40 family peptidase [Oceanirhabdus sp. W0125-5]|uniref:C40 family peptidase n=1 Tax=Oceanirhabdus sp. W0125-5 TaxID=2999116 RepID=UPI0022F32701|nr:C40 family peptidase [Oceanirhabdus sp. W0125-5]WBW95873.1 C40 family peptidase [Oceanirhabdus sp. W0125-5]